MHAWHWYFSEGFPVICALQLPLIIAGGFQHARRRLVDVRGNPACCSSHQCAWVFLDQFCSCMLHTQYERQGVFRDHAIAKVLGGTHDDNDSETAFLQLGGMAATAPRRAPPRHVRCFQQQLPTAVAECLLGTRLRPASVSKLHSPLLMLTNLCCI